MIKKTTLLWFRQDLRLSDNPALKHAADNGNILPIFILDETSPRALGAASKVWLHHSLLSLQKDLSGHLQFLRGNPEEIISNLTQKHNIKNVFWNRCYDPHAIARDTSIKDRLSKNNISCHSMNGALLWEPWDIKKQDGTPYKVFTPFYRKGCLSAKPPRLPLAPPEQISFSTTKISDLTVNDLQLIPKIRWDNAMMTYWTIGENAAQKKLNHFITNSLCNYKEGRNYPALDYTSRLSPHLHFGEISPNQAWYAALKQGGENNNTDCFLSELGWREFSHHLLYYFPELPQKNWQPKFNNFQWDKDDTALHAWQMGQTGIPIIDAGMRELWQTGYMHNRVRMIVGSFLVKNLLIHWNEGEKWFWDTLFDADLANNSASWQWVAGCGADAAPYFRIFNPVTQGQKFDPDGIYTRKFIPELAKLPEKYLFNPWEAPKSILAHAGITLGDTYPKPIIDLKLSRERALAAFKSL